MCKQVAESEDCQVWKIRTGATSGQVRKSPEGEEDSAGINMMPLNWMH